MARMTTTTEYIRQERRNRATGTVVQVLDLCHPDTEFDPETESEYDADGRKVGERVVNRWMTVCLDHGMICTHSTIALAESHAAVPEWCEDCAPILAAKGWS